LVAGTSLGDVIGRARRQSFVGRRSELRTFDDAQAGRSPRRVLFVHGPGGIGKTTLLHEMRARASAAGRTTLLLDGSEIDPSPDGFSQAVEAADPAHAAQDARADSGHSGTVLLVDGYEQLGVDEAAGGPRYVVYGNDWRRFPVDTWLDLMNEREHCGGTGPPPDSALRPPPLSRAAFGDAVRSALQHLNRPDRLTGCPLLGTVLGADAAELRASIVTASDRLAGEPKGDQLRAVLNRTFVRAAPTQEAAAEVLGLPFSTYRRHLARAIDELTEALWAVEIGTAPPVRTSK